MTSDTELPFNTPKVAILLGSYNGETYIQEQLNSFVNQDMGDWHLWVSDDGSTDNTHAILGAHPATQSGRVTILNGPRQGFSKNFLSLVNHPQIAANYYAYSDQDDIWHSDKLSKAIAWLDTIDPTIPALYGARSTLIDQNNHEIGITNHFTQPFTFQNALVQNVAAGNTMVFNQAARDILKHAGLDITVSFHDWWTYILVTGYGGKVMIDQSPVLRYRQHGNNVFGRNNNLQAKLTRIKKLFSGQMREWNDLHVNVLNNNIQLLTPENQLIFKRFARGRNRWLLPRLAELKQSGIYRQLPSENLGLTLAALLKKL